MNKKMRKPYKLHLKNYHEFSWVVAALNFLSKHYGKYGDPLGDCYYNSKEAKEMFKRIEEEFLEYSWETLKQKDSDGNYYLEFEDNVECGSYCSSDWMVEYYDKEEAKSRVKNWYLCNTTMQANCTKIAMGIDDIHIEECLHDLDLYGAACDRVLTSDELVKFFSHSNKEYKKWIKSEEGQEWLNSDD